MGVEAGRFTERRLGGSGSDGAAGGGLGRERAPGRERPPARSPRWVRALLAGLVTAAVVVPLMAAVRPGIPAPDPADLAPVTASTLEEAYAANRANAELAARTAAGHGDRHRAAADRALAVPSRRLLFFDGRGSGRVAEVFGDLAHTGRVAVLVPGSDTSLDTYERFHTAAAALHRGLTRQAPAGTGTGTGSGSGTGTGSGTGSGTAVVAWLGYTTPATVSTTAITPDRADEAAPDLREFVRGLRGLTGPASRITLLCHSYGSVVCGRAADGLDADDLVLLGSPGTGTGADSAADLRTRARVWAARGSDDWVAEVPHTAVALLGTTVGFGTDPVSPDFGARVFFAGDGGHSDYFRPGSACLANLVRIVLGETSEVTRA
ncbi:alpha/beta hydrolase [Streptomyces sp. NPDC017202]|uniref:alpha/beta hydrolase n=1 Tax=Streptomyces sp. NPDC017202 TaxID=3364981 RepID=UPI00378D1322